MRYVKLLLAVSLILGLVALGAPALAQDLLPGSVPPVPPGGQVGGQLISRAPTGGGGGGGLPAGDVGAEVFGGEVSRAPAEGAGGLPVTGANLVMFVIIGAAAIAGGELLRRRGRSKAEA